MLGKIILGIAALTLALGLSACGDADSPDPPQASAPVTEMAPVSQAIDPVVSLCSALQNDFGAHYSDGSVATYLARAEDGTWSDVSITDIPRESVTAHCPAYVDTYDAYVADVAGAAAAEAEEAARQALIASGDLVGDGSYVVGTTMKSGTWRTTPGGLITDCYWERATGNGDIIDNNFMNAATSVTVIVRNGEVVTLDGCGDWQRVGSSTGAAPSAPSSSRPRASTAPRAPSPVPDMDPDLRERLEDPNGYGYTTGSTVVVPDTSSAPGTASRGTLEDQLGL